VDKQTNNNVVEMTLAHTITQAMCPAVQELQCLPQWVLWDSQKEPYNAQTGRLAQSNDKTTWCKYGIARKALQHNSDIYKGVGFMFDPYTGVMGIDLDHCINEQREIDQWAQEIVLLLNSYTEVSQSGEGLHILVKGTTPDHAGLRRILKGQRHEKAAVEIYSKGRYFAMTFHRLAGTPETIEYRQEQIEQLLTLYASKPEPSPMVRHSLPVASRLDDSQLIEKACQASAKFKALWYGDWSHYGSQSEADSALCVGLAFWTQKDEYQMDRLFRQSGLYREDKWDRNARSGETYGQGTLRRACDLTGEVYNPRHHQERLEEDVRRLINKLFKQQEKGKRRQVVYQLQPKEVGEKCILESLEMNEYGDALLFSQIFEGQVLYDHTEKEWYLWAGHYWKKDGRGKVKQLVSGVLGTAYLKSAAEMNTTLAETTGEIERLLAKGIEGMAEAEPLKEKAKSIKSNMSKLTLRARDLRGANRCKNALSFIQTFMGITSDMWDTNMMLLPTEGGVIDLENEGTFRPGQPDDYIRIVAPTEWQGLQASCPRFLQYLHEIFADRNEQERAELINFLQRLLGYCITGQTTHHIFPILFGEEGRNGKDTLIKVLVAVLGPLVGACSNDVFIARDRQGAGGAATPHLCDLQGKRLVWGSETKQGDRLNIAQIKQLSGGGDISTRQLHGKQYTFTPTHKMLLMTNYKPHADAKDKAFWSRACLIQFNLRFVDKPQAANEQKADHQLDKALQSEVSGILAWLVQGCLKWQREGLDIPTSIQIATEAYRDSEDRVLHFIEESCVLAEHATVGAGRLYDAYVQFCKNNQIKPMDGKLFGQDLSKRYEKKKKSSGFVYIGIGLLAPDPSPFDETHAGSVQGENDGSLSPKQASQADGVDNHGSECAGCAPKKQVFSFSQEFTGSHEEKHGFTMHTLHSQSAKNTMKEPVELTQALYTEEKHPALSLHTEQGTIEERARRFYDEFCSRPGYHLRLQPDGQISIGVPESVSDTEFEGITAQVLGQGQALLKVLQDVSKEQEASA
jgi:putative DNA primase/helicase